MAQIHSHHPDRKKWKNWTLALKSYQHKTVMIVEQEEATPENYALLHNLIISLNYREEIMRRELDLKDAQQDKD